MTRTPTRWFCTFAVLCALSAWTGAALGAPPKPAPQKPAAAPASPARPPLEDTLTGEAKTDYAAAKVLYGDGDYAGALVKFSAAYDASKDPRLLWDMAACQKNLRHYAKVIALVHRYLDEGGSALSEQDKSDARALLVAIEPFTAQLTIDVNQPGSKIYVDSELVGTSPLPKPVVVDIGMRQIRVTKPGYVEFDKALPVGGAKDVTEKVELREKPHIGKLSVSSSPGARITLDGKQVGKGSFSATVPSGRHTLRVTAPGMRPYSSAVVIQDNETRNVDVVLEPIPEAAPKAEPRGPLHGFDVGVRGVYGEAERSHHQMLALRGLWLDIGYRLGRPTFLGVYAQTGQFDRSGTCGVDRHGATPDSPTDLQPRYAYTRCIYVKLGAELLFHTMPRTIVDPWFGFDVGVQGSFYEVRSYDPLTGRYGGGGDDDPPSVAPGAQIGVDARPWKGLSIGPFFQFAPRIGGDGGRPNPTLTPTAPTANQNTSNGAPGSSHTTARLNLVGGLRAGYAFQ